MESPFKEIDPTQFKRYWLDVAYADQHPRQIMDIWLPDEGDGPFPLVVFVHGGAWMFGNKRENTMPSLFKFMQQGYALACLQYRTAPESHWPLPLYDVRAAIRFLRANAEKYNLKADKIALLGNSAGGQISNVVAALNGRDIMKGKELGNPDVDDSVQCLVNFFAPSDMYAIDLTDFGPATMVADKTEETTTIETDGGDPMKKPHNIMLGYPALDNRVLADTASGIKYVKDDFPPAYFLHGLKDTVVPISQSVSMWRTVNRVCGEGHAKLEIFPEAGHGDPMMKTDEVMSRTLDFIDQYLWEGEHNRPPFPPDVKLLD